MNTWTVRSKPKILTVASTMPELFDFIQESDVAGLTLSFKWNKKIYLSEYYSSVGKIVPHSLRFHEYLSAICKSSGCAYFPDDNT